MKDTKIQLCNYCQKPIVERIGHEVSLCVVERQRPSTEDYPKNLNRETKDIFYHQECYKEKQGFTEVDIKKIIENFEKTMTIHHYSPEKVFPVSKKDK